MSKIISAAEAAKLIDDDAFVACAGVIGWVTPDAVLRGIGQRFEQSASPRNLTFYFPCGTGDAMGIKGMDHVARPGLMKRIISGSFINPVDPETGARPRLMGMIKADQVQAYSWPIGASMHWLREVARRSPGYITRIGIGTYADPRLEGGKFTPSAKEDLVRIIELDGEEFMFYPSRRVDVAIVRAASADEKGNLSWEDEPLLTANIALVLAAKASGGKVIAQVRRIVDRRERSATQNRIPGTMVDHIVVDPDMMMTTDTPYEPAYFSGRRMPLEDLPVPKPSMDKIIASRIADEVREGEVSIYGFGAASDVPLLMAERGLFDDGGIDRFPATTEHGAHGGIVMPGWQFSANLNPDALLDGLYQFDAIDGGLCPFAALSFAQFDAAGNVNVSRFAGANPGAGGFIDIAHNAKRLVFAGTFTTGGLEATVSGGRLDILKEGRFVKFVGAVDSITYRAFDGIVARDQSALIVTERAVFELHAGGLVLIEIAPGINLQADILARMDFAPTVSPDLKLMDAKHFEDEVKSIMDTPKPRKVPA